MDVLAIGPGLGRNITISEILRIFLAESIYP